MGKKNGIFIIKEFLMNIKSKFILKKIFEQIQYNKLLELIRYNRNLQNRLQKGLNDYKEYLKTEIEIIPNSIFCEKFMNIKDNDAFYFHIYFNDSKNEIKFNELFSYKFIRKIKVIIEFEFKLFNRLFKNCHNIQKIKFIKFNRKDITDITGIFRGCINVEEINLSKINTEN